MQMLYERWRRIARERDNEVALRELSSGRHWSFAQLARLGGSPGAGGGPVVYPQGHSVEFIVAVLRAWRQDAVVCPLEPEQKPPPVPLPPASCRHLKITSATTGAHRVIAFRAEQLAADAANIVVTMGLRPDWPNVGVISMAHSYGFSNLVLPLLLHGIPLVLAPSPLPEALRAAAECESFLTLPAVPALWRAWLEAGAVPRNVRLAISAGAPLPLRLERAVFDAIGLKIHNFYGASECGGIAYDATAAPRADDACVGAPMRNVQLALDQNARIQVRSGAVGETYWPDADGTLEAGCFQTSDLGRLEDGGVFLCGRSNDQINVAGRKVSPAAVEQALLEHEAVNECLVFGVPSNDPDRIDMIVACVVTKGNGDTEELRQFLLRRLPAWQVPRDWWFVKSLTPNPRGKVSRADWRRKFLEMRDGRGAPVTPGPRPRREPQPTSTPPSAPVGR
jgi:acyl-CoA synthetase (AMP-forming)/AMP-acid ligase II